MINLREESDDRPKTHNDFEFVKKGSENLFVVGFGRGAGKVHMTLEKYDHYVTEGHFFVKCHHEEVRDRIKTIESELIRLSREYQGTPGMYHCNKKIIVEVYDQHFETISEDIL